MRKIMPVVHSPKGWKGIKTPMKTKGWKVKKGIAHVAAAAMLLGLLPMTPANTLTVEAKDNLPSMSGYATKDELMTLYTPNSDGSASQSNFNTLVFGKDDSKKAMTWYILGKDTGVEGDNIAIFATAPIVQSKMFREKNNNNMNNLEECNYEGVNVTDVDLTHYGVSAIRDELKGLATDANYFSATERSLMNVTKIRTWDTKKSTRYYTVEDKLYLLACAQCDPGTKGTALWAGSGDQIVLSMNSYWSSGKYFWLRTPRNQYDVWFALPGSAYFDHNCMLMEEKDYPNGFSVRPAANLNLSSVLFASAVPVLTSEEGPQNGELYYGGSKKSLTLRMDGTGKNIGTVIYDAYGKITATKDEDAKGDVWLVVQNPDGNQTVSYYYSTKVDGTMTIDTSLISTARLNKADLSKCKIWLEAVEDDGMTYAVNATYKEPFQAPAVYNMNIGATPLYTVPYGWNQRDGAKVYFGYDDSQNLPVLSRVLATPDTQTVTGSSVLLHSDGVTQKAFNEQGSAAWKDSTLETFLNEDYYDNSFTDGEKNVIKETTLNAGTGYKAGRGSYSDQEATDFLFSLSASEADTLYEDADARKQGETWWLRSNATDSTTEIATVNTDGNIVKNPYTDTAITVSPAFNLDLSAVLLTTVKDVDKTSPVAADSSDLSAVYGGEKEWKLTLRDRNKSIQLQDNRIVTEIDGTIKVPYVYTDSSKVEESVNQISVMITDGEYTAAGAKILYYGALQGAETNLNLTVTGTGTFVLPDALKDKTLGSDYHVYLLAEHVSGACRTDYSSEPYEIKEIKKLVAVGSVAITGIDVPVAGKALDTTAECATEGVSIQSVEWKTSDLMTSVTTAEYETGYAVLVNLKANDGYVFSPDVTGTLNGTVAEVEKDLTNKDGTITAAIVWIKFPETGKDKLVSITAPSSRIVKNGTAYENMGLPTTVAIVTEGQTVTTAAVAWDTTTPAAGSYDPALETEQTVTLNGTVTCPDTIDPNGVSLATTITITIRAMDATSHFITVSSGDAGSVSPDGIVEVPDGGSQTFTITPNEGYEVDTVKVDGNSVGAVTSYTFENVTEDHMLEALFKQSGAPAETPAPTETPAPAETPAPTATPTPTATPASSEESDSSEEPEATATPASTATPAPTAPPAPVKTPVPTKAPAETPAPEAYRILDGVNSKWVLNEDGSVIIRGNGEFNKFTGVKVDGELIDEENYTASEGSTIIALKKEYLDTLPEGTHSFEILWTDGSASTNFLVAKNTADGQENSGNTTGSGDKDSSDASVPANGGEGAVTVLQPEENGSSVPWAILVVGLVVLAGAVGVFIFTQKRNS